MKKKITIKVTPWHIARGKLHNKTSCPVALATKKHFRNADIEVCASVIKVYVETKLLEFDLPEQVKKWIGKFDKGQSVKPIQFVIKVWKQKRLFGRCLALSLP